MDLFNPVVQLCARGMQAEAKGQPDLARDLFVQAWNRRRDAFDACVAAHFVARHQPTPEAKLHWNEEALAQAQAAGETRVRDFLPSLYLNLGHSWEQVGDPAEARRFYRLADARTEALPDDRYRQTIRSALDGAARRLGEADRDMR